MIKTAVDCRTDRQSADWKIAIAAHLKRTTQASNRWLAEHLHMGTPVAVTQYVSALSKLRRYAAPDHSATG